MSALPFGLGIFVTFNKENYHVYRLILTKHWSISLCCRKV